MPKKQNDDIFITDSGVITTNKRLHISIFVFLCRFLTVVLGILGVLAFYEGNFR